jgi:hypothetical protein
MARLPITGLIHVTGESDCGKTSFALECGASPSRILFLDSDVKGRSTVQQLRDAGVEFGGYYDMLAETRGMREIQIYNRYMEILSSVKPGQYDALIWDTFTEFENTLKPVVSKDPRKFREYYSAMGVIKAGEEWQASFDYEAELISDMLSKIPLVILITHLKSYNVGGKRVEGKFIPACKAPLVTKSLFRLWLRRNPAGPVPIGLVMKRLNKKYIDDKGRIRTINVLPLKVVPQDGDISLWDTIEHFWEKPFGDSKPTAAETPDEYEQSILEGTLTEDQRLALKIALLEAQEEAVDAEQFRQARAETAESVGFSVQPKESPAAAPINDDEVAKVLAVREGLTAKDIAASTGIPLPRVMKILKDNPE